MAKKRITSTNHKLEHASLTSLHTQGSSSGRKPPHGRLLATHRTLQENHKPKNKQEHDAKRKNFLKREPVPRPSSDLAYSFKDATIDLARTPKKLELHPTKQAPTLTEMDNRIARQKEADKLRFFGVPIKIYEPDENGHAIDLSNVKYTEEDKLDLRRYGARIIMTNEGRVAAVEVDHELVKDQLRKKKMQGEICECVEVVYDISEKLMNNPTTRRRFMVKVLALEMLLRVPSLFALHYQRFKEMHDFLYQQNLLLFLVVAIIQGTRLAGLYYSEIGQYEPCRSIIGLLTITGYSLTATLLTSMVEKYSIHYIEYKLYDEPSSLATLYIKRSLPSGRRVAYPYVFSLMLSYMACMNLIIIVLLLLPKRVMNELKNAFVFIHIVTAVILTFTVGYCIFYVKIPYISANPLGWDGSQILFAWLITTKWVIWRHYMLQQVVKGKVRKVDEDMYWYVALNYAI